MSNNLKQTILEYLEATAGAAGFPEPRSIPEIAGAIIGVFLSFMGIIFLSLIIYAGFVWMISGGNEQKVLKAKKTITSAVIGLFIILASYSITSFVFQSLQTVSN